MRPQTSSHTVNFRAHLFTAVRHKSGRLAALKRRVRPVSGGVDTPIGFGGGGLDAFEREAVRAAYRSLPASWRLVLWRLDVEGFRPGELGGLLGISAGAVSARAYRARGALRNAYLREHVSADTHDVGPICGPLLHHLVRLVRGNLEEQRSVAVRAHLATCPKCHAAHEHLQDVNLRIGD